MRFIYLLISDHYTRVYACIFINWTGAKRSGGGDAVTSFRASRAILI